MLVRKIRSRGANIVVEAHGEVLFAATGDVGKWQNRFSHRVRNFAAAAAPTNKRPRWSHYGKPLKSTFTATTRYQPGRMRVYSAIGSSAPHAYYVDQGTGVYAGNGPYKAKVLPPWTRGSASLYEHTWHPPNQAATGTRLSVLIRGQEGQGFFDKGLARGFASMRMRAFQVAGDPKITNALKSMPTGMTNFAGNTAADGAFLFELKQWREWRDAAFNSGRVLGKGSTRESRRRADRKAATAARRRRDGEQYRERRREESKKRSQKRRDEQKAKNQSKPAKPEIKQSNSSAKRNERLRFIAAAVKKYGSDVDLNSLEFEGGYWYLTVKVFTKRDADGEMRPDFKEIRGRKVG